MASWDVATAQGILEFDTIQATYISARQIDDNHFIAFWRSYNGLGTYNGYAQVFTVNTSTWEVATAAASFLFVVSPLYNSCFQIDSNHFINFWAASLGPGYSQVFTVDTSTWEVSTAADSLQFDTVSGAYNSCFQIDSNHFINFWAGSDNDGFVQVFTVNTSTWAVATAANSLEFDTVNGQLNSCFQIDSNHFINFWAGNGSDGYTQIFTVNTSTWAVATANNALEFDTTAAYFSSCYPVDSNHFINFWGTGDVDGFVQVFTVNTSTWAVATAANSLEFDTRAARYNNAFQIDSNHFINFWAGTDSQYGRAQTFAVTLPSGGPSFLPAWARNANSIFKVM